MPILSKTSRQGSRETLSLLPRLGRSAAQCQTVADDHRQRARVLKGTVRRELHVLERPWEMQPTRPLAEGKSVFEMTQLGSAPRAEYGQSSGWDSRATISPELNMRFALAERDGVELRNERVISTVWNCSGSEFGLFPTGVSRCGRTLSKARKPDRHFEPNRPAGFASDRAQQKRSYVSLFCSYGSRTISLPFRVKKPFTISRSMSRGSVFVEPSTNRTFQRPALSI